jgi:hypothetical protein
MWNNPYNVHDAVILQHFGRTEMEVVLGGKRVFDKKKVLNLAV